MMDAFPNAMPIEGMLGGLMIGCAAAAMLLVLGRIAGVSGLAARATGIAASGPPRVVAVAFVLGLPMGALLLRALHGPISVQFVSTPATLIVAGLLVGYGTRLGSGCTSGHGVCGLSRLSPRSLAATGLFMASGFLAVGLLRLASLL